MHGSLTRICGSGLGGWVVRVVGWLDGWSGRLDNSGDVVGWLSDKEHGERQQHRQALQEGPRK